MTLNPKSEMHVATTIHIDGVRYHGLRWNSLAFQTLRVRLGRRADVTIRFDTPLRRAYVFDPNNGEWLAGDLVRDAQPDDRQ